MIKQGINSLRLLILAILSSFGVVAQCQVTLGGFNPSPACPGVLVTMQGTGLAGTSAITFGGVAGSVIFSAPTNLVARIPVNAPSGNVAVVVTSPSGTGQANMDILQADDASFSYPRDTMCTNEGSILPTIVSLGGTFVEATQMVSLSASTGQIDLAATPNGTYTISYSTIGTCPDSGNATVTVMDPPALQVIYAVDTICWDLDSLVPTLLSPPGGTFFASLGLDIRGNGAIYPANSFPGAHLVEYQYTAPSGCSDTLEFIMVIDTCTMLGRSEVDNLSRLEIYPNPADEVLHLDLVLLQAEKINLSLLDMRGQLVISRTWEQKSKSLNHALDLSRIESGLYLLSVKAGDSILLKRVVIQ